METSLTQSLREGLKRKMNPGYPDRPLSLRDVSRATGVPKPTLARFMRGRNIIEPHIDKITEYLRDLKSGEEEIHE